ncbi:MAG: DNA-processing protein DprA [Bacteroidota bacterium]
MSRTSKTNPTLEALVALSLIHGLGARRVRLLIRHFNDPASIFKRTKAELRAVEGIGEASALAVLSFKDWAAVEKLIAQTDRNGSQLITLMDDRYPTQLKQIYDPPVLLWVKGNPEALSKPGIAVVGTRQSTSYGKKITQQLVQQLVQQDLCIYSGLAYGIDVTAHQMALEHDGCTVAVLGSGIDVLYPSRHAAVANQIIASGGAVLTECPPGTPPDAGNFPLRNRIVSGLSLGVLVTESAIQGGSMITADLALDQNREVFAAPHALDNVQGSGCNYLIKNGAKLVQTVDDILEELPLEHHADTLSRADLPEPKHADWKLMDLDSESQALCRTLEEQSIQIDELADRLSMSTSQLLVLLLRLEMKGIVIQKAGKMFELA